MRLRPFTAALLCFVAAAPVCGEPDEAEDTGDTSTTDGTDVETDTDDSEADTDWRDHDVDPVAVCFAVPATWQESDGEPVRLDGTASFGIGLNHLVAWDWEVVDAPEGSEAEPEVQAPGLHHFTPDRIGHYELELTVTDEHGAVSEPCLATVDAFFGRPTLQCSVVNPPNVFADGLLQAEASGDWSPFTYRWSIIEDTTGAVLLSPQEQVTALQVDDVGLVTTRVVATDAVGAESLPCNLEISASDDRYLSVTLTWSHPGEDLDLHLIREPGVIGTVDDCYYGNCRSETDLDWGIAGDSNDNPVLVLDDIAGTGPEVLEIADPRSIPETLRVVVVDYPGSVRNEPTEAMVSIHLGGALVYSTTFTVTGEESETDVARFDGPSLTVTPILPAVP